MLRYEFELVIPTGDGICLLLQIHKSQLARADYIYLLSDEAYQITSNKALTYSMARDLGISVPPQVVAFTRNDLEAAVHEFGFPIVVKRPHSAEVYDPLTKCFVEKIKCAEELISIATPMLAKGPVLVQQHFVGIGVGVETLCRDGEVLIAFQHERLHEPLGGGGSSYRKSVALDSELLDATRQLMKALSYTGVCMVEFRYNPKTRRWVLIEINGRFWGSLPLAVAAGIEFPKYLYEMLRYGKTKFSGDYPVDLYCRNWVLDLIWFRLNRKVDRSDISEIYVPLHRVMAEFGNVLRMRERNDTFTIDDPAPAVEEIRSLFARLLFATAQYFYPVRFYMQSRIRAALRKASSVLFVCKGNICRSPFAELYVRRCLPSVTVSSVGTLQVHGRPSPDVAIEAAALQNVDLSGHRSRAWTEADAKNWDVFIVFDVDQYRTIRHIAARYNAANKVFLLGALDIHGPLQIADPVGKDVRTFQAIYRRIAQSLDRAVAPASNEAFSPKGATDRFCEAESIETDSTTSISKR